MEEIFSSFGKALVRTPLYPWQKLFRSDESTHSLESLVRRGLKDAVFLEALYWSSPQLYERVEGWKAGLLRGEKEKNLFHTLMKYLIRAHTRPTPYGIFAGTCLVVIDEKRKATPGKMSRKVRADSGLLQNIVHSIEADPMVFPRLRYSLNNTIYRIPGQFRFTETLFENGKTWYQLSSLEDNLVLDNIYRMMMAHRQLGLSEISEPLKTAGFDLPDGFAEALIESQFLVSEFRQGPTVKDEIKAYLKILERLKAEGTGEVEKYIDLLLSLRTTAESFQGLPLGTLPREEMEKIKGHMERCRVISCQGHLFHVDLKKEQPSGFVLSSEQVMQIQKGIGILAWLSADENREGNMASFKKLFLKKYGAKEIRLSEALDPEYGIGFPAYERIGDRLFNSLIESSQPGVENGRPGCTNGLLQKTSLVYFPTTEEIRLEEKDLCSGEPISKKIPSFLSVMGSVLPSGKILLEGVGKMHANALPGRFAYLEPGINGFCKDLAAKEQIDNEEVVFAEIVFQPGGRSGNIVRRLPFFQYEIPYLASAGVPEEKQLPVNDLLVSVRNDEIVLRSERLNKRVIPRLSNAHNFTISSLPVYQFLSFLQYPDETALEINWGPPGFKRRFLPWVTYENLVLHRARWFLFREDIMQICSGHEPVSLLKSFLSKWKVARFVSLSEGDNELFIDTFNPDYLELLLKEMQKQNAIILTAWPFGVPGPNNDAGRYGIHQFILPLVKRNGEKHLPFKKAEPTSRIRESFEPGSEWVYFKIYCSAGFSDKILIEAIKPVLDLLLKEKVVSSAFFIRYTDPYYHIRLRFRLREDRRKEGFARALDLVYHNLQPFSEAGIIWDIQLDTYRPEIERYGPASIAESETAFFYDSRLFLRCLEHEGFAGNDETRFLTAIKNLDKWLSVYRLDRKEKLHFCKAMVESFSKEFGPEFKFRIDLKYREFSEVIPGFLASSVFDREFEERETNLLNLSLPRKNLSSYIHMSMNRWFVTEQRLLEYTVYIFAVKYYKQIFYYHSKLPDSLQSDENKS